jgi:hypothetical protein
VLEIKPYRLHAIRAKSILKAACPPVILAHWSYWPKTAVLGHHRNATTPMMALCGLQMRGFLSSSLVEEPRPYDELFRAKCSPIPFSAHCKNIFSDSLERAPTAQ